MNLKFIGSNTLAFLLGLLIMFIIIRFTLGKKCPKTECPSCPECPVCESKEEFARKRGKKEANDTFDLDQTLQNMYNDANDGYSPFYKNLDIVNRTYAYATGYKTRFGFRSGFPKDPNRPFVPSSF